MLPKVYNLYRSLYALKVSAGWSSALGSRAANLESNLSICSTSSAVPAGIFVTVRTIGRPIRIDKTVLLCGMPTERKKTPMKSLVGAALTLWLAIAASAAAQTDAPAPPPVAVDSVAPPTLGLPQAIAAPHLESFPIGPSVIPEIRVPASYGAFFNTPNPETPYIDPSALRRDRAANVLENGCAACTTTCAPLGRIWGEFDYLYWTARGDNVPSLVTTSPIGTAAGQAGVLGTPGVRTLSGAAAFSDDYRSGLRYNVGVWLDAGQTLGVQVGGFLLDDGATHNALTSAGNPILARPFTNAITGAAASQLVAFPDVVVGSLAVDHRSSVNGFDAALRGNMCCAATWRLDALFGYRYLRLEDGLTINQNLVAGPASLVALGVTPGTSFATGDRFQTTNTFNGLELGLAGEQRFGSWFATGVVKASLGWIDHIAAISGDTRIAGPGLAPVQSTGGLLALSSNIGRFKEVDAVIIPEMSLGLGYQLGKYVRIRAGYSFLYISSVARPGTIIDTTVNPGLIPPPTGAAPPTRPLGQTERSDFILHGVNAGVEVHF
jgi:hypothetical protein